MDIGRTSDTVELNSCCSLLLKLKCWLILAKYGASKLKLVEQVTQDAALDEFETRFALKKRLLSSKDAFLELAQNIYKQTSTSISKYISSPDWSLFYEHGNSMWQLNKIIRNETESTMTTFPFYSHLTCLEGVHVIREEIFSVINSWSDITYTYYNYTSATLSAIFAKRMDSFINKHEVGENYFDSMKILDDLVKEHVQCSSSFQIKNEKHDFWFLTESLNFSEDFIDDVYYPVPSEENRSSVLTRISDRLFKESVDEFRANTEQLMRFDEKCSDIGFFDKGTLSAYFEVPETELSFSLMTPTSESGIDINLAEGPHYSFDGSTLIELQSVSNIEKVDLLECVREEDNNIFWFENDRYFNSIDSVLQDNENEQLNDKISQIKVELNNSYGSDGKSNQTETNTERIDLLKENAYNVEKNTLTMPKLQIIGRHEVQRTERSNSTCADVPLRKRGRPRKVDDCQSAYKNGQHKYSPENVLDCSNWISDNFIEIPGNKPAIDRARLYELYTNYCTLKFCVPVDRALFGKIIRKVFPQLKSRRLIQNQVLKYHYVGLKPKFPELEQALMSTDFTNPQEIFVLYEPVEE